MRRSLTKEGTRPQLCDLLKGVVRTDSGFGRARWLDLPESVSQIVIWREQNLRAGCKRVTKQLGMDFAMDKLRLKKFFAPEAATLRLGLVTRGEITSKGNGHTAIGLAVIFSWIGLHHLRASF